jgi:hypothetical protein
MFESNIHSLLLGDAAIRENHEMLAKISEDDFNIYSIVHLQSDTLRHAFFIRNILDPKGLHGHGMKFLKLFLTCLGREEYTDEDITHAEVKIEEGFGCMPVNYHGEGRTAIIIKPGSGKTIVIVHQMYAADHEMQSEQYSGRYPDRHCYHLTLSGSEAHPGRLRGRKNGAPETGKRFTGISYQHHILQWLEQCKQETTGDQALEHILNQYISILKGLTGRSDTTRQGYEIADTVLNQENNMKVAQGIQMTLHDLEKQATEIAAESFGKARITKDLFTSRLRHEIRTTLVLDDSEKRYAIYFSFYFLTPQQIGLSAYIDWDDFKWKVEINPPNYYITNIDEMYRALKKSSCRMNSSLAEITASMEKWIYRFIEQTEKYNIFLNQQGA